MGNPPSHYNYLKRLKLLVELCEEYDLEVCLSGLISLRDPRTERELPGGKYTSRISEGDMKEWFVNCLIMDCVGEQ
jgi:hypothetical protein